MALPLTSGGRRHAPDVSYRLEKGLDVLLVSMPFAILRQPSIGLSLLKSGLTGLGVSAKVRYFTFRFARLVGAGPYTRVCLSAPQDLLGEWIFARALFDHDAQAEERYVEDVLLGKSSAHGHNRGRSSPTFIRRVRHMRRRVDLFLDSCLRTISSERPRVVGFTSMFQQHVASLALAKRVKTRLPHIFIVFGGANCEGEMGVELLRQFSFVDAVVSGEGDLVFPHLVGRVLSGKPIDHLQGVYSRACPPSPLPNGRHPNAPAVLDMDQLPFPDYDDCRRQYRSSRLKTTYSPILLFETSRGCWWGERMQCTFCGHNGDRMAYRSKSVARALEEVAYLTQKYREPAMRAVDNILDLGYFKDFIPQLAQRGLRLDLFYEVKANLTKEQLELLRRAGARQIQPGIESLSTQVLKLMRKGVTGLQNIQLLKWCREVGIGPVWNVLWGFPQESPEEYVRIAELVPLLTHLEPPQSAGRFRLDRFSPNFECAEQFGFINVAPYPSYSHVYPLDRGAVARLASYFTYDYRSPRHPDEYARPLWRELRIWASLEEPSLLFFVDRDRELLVWDERPVAVQKLTVLSGLDREIYLACDTAQNIRHLQRCVRDDARKEPAEAELTDRLQSLVARRLMVREGHCYLSLAIPVGTYRPPRAALRRMADTAARRDRVSRQPDIPVRGKPAA